MPIFETVRKEDSGGRKNSRKAGIFFIQQRKGLCVNKEMWLTGFGIFIKHIFSHESQTHDNHSTFLFFQLLFPFAEHSEIREK